MGNDGAEHPYPHIVTLIAAGINQLRNTETLIDEDKRARWS